MPFGVTNFPYSESLTIVFPDLPGNEVFLLMLYFAGQKRFFCSLLQSFILGPVYLIPLTIVGIKNDYNYIYFIEY